MSTKTSELSPGTISHGTMREQDLIPRFLNALESVNPEEAKRIRDEYSSAIAHLERDDTFTDAELDEISWLLNEVLFDALNDHAPGGFYFGSHPGDGSDYGIWPIESDED